MSITPAELIEEIENLSPVDIDQEIEDLEGRIGLLRRVKKMIAPAGVAKKERKPRKPKEPDHSNPMSQAEPHIQVEHYLRVNGPTGYRDLMSHLRMSPAQLAEAIEAANVRKVDKLYELL